MELTFFGQPWQDGSNLDDFIDLVVSQAGPQRMRLAAAWAKRSGLSRIRPALEAWRAAGGTVQMVVGISEGGATRQGLELALDLADSVHLFHDVSGRTFHPKVYLAETSEATSVLVGSSNLTAGGLYFNYEAGIAVQVPTPDVPSSELIKRVQDWFDRLLDDADCCRTLTPEDLPALIEQPAFRIGDEDKRRRPASDEPAAPEEIDTVTPTGDAQVIPFFRRSTSAKKGARFGPPAGPAPDTDPHHDQSRTSSGGTEPPAPIAIHVTQPVATHAVMRWSKQLKGTDAQQPPGANTSPTYNLRLAAARHQIDISSYWREEFFDNTPWQTDPADPGIEYTVVEMDVYVYGQSFGRMEFRVDHDLGRVAQQGNVPTVLKWGPMSVHMRAQSHVDDWVLLEKLDDDTFTLRIEAVDPGTR